MPPRRPTAPTECPVCGEALPPRARSCPACGADERTGWDPDSVAYDGLDLPDEAFDDEDTPPHAPLRRRPRLLWLGVAVLLVLLLGWLALAPF